MLCLVDDRSKPKGYCTAHASVKHYNGDKQEPFGVSCPDHANNPRILAPSGNENAEYEAQYAYACGYYD